jgi:predicted RNA-binding Zn-ribbon protein involved in translation (DUF1610 family)
MAKAKKRARRSAPRFFCDNCGKEVGKDEKRCPVCGRYFSAIRCPKCGFAGEETQFRNGCPACGYSARPPRQQKPEAAEEKVELPLWVYIIVIGIMTLALALLLFHSRA